MDYVFYSICKDLYHIIFLCVEWIEWIMIYTSVVDQEWFIPDPDPVLNFSSSGSRSRQKFRIHVDPDPDPTYIN